MLKSPYTKLSLLLNRSQTLLTSTSSSATNFGQGILDSISDFASLEGVNSEEVLLIIFFIVVFGVFSFKRVVIVA